VRDLRRRRAASGVRCAAAMRLVKAKQDARTLASTL
jgi:hypothetical protein